MIFSLQYITPCTANSQHPNTVRDGYPPRQRRTFPTTHLRGKMRFSTKQRLLILITYPISRAGLPWLNPTVKDIERGLREQFGIIRTRRHIRRLLQELEHQAIIKREKPSRQPPYFSFPEQATRYMILDFDRAFQNHLSLTRHAKVILARERTRRKRKEDRAYHLEDKLRRDAAPHKTP